MSSTYILNLWKSYMITHLKYVPCYLSNNTLDRKYKHINQSHMQPQIKKKNAYVFYN